MKPRAHLRSMQFVEILLALLAAGLMLLGHARITAMGLDLTLAIVCGVILVPILFHKLVARRIAAECTQCGGRSYPGSSRCYTCADCGHRDDLNPWSRQGSIGRVIHNAVNRQQDENRDRGH